MKMYLFRAGMIASALVFSPAAFAGDDIEEGRNTYTEFCVGCHGKDMANPGLAFDLRTFPKGDEARFRKSVLNGKGGGMPAWQDKLTDEDLKVLWAYVVSGG